MKLFAANRETFGPNELKSFMKWGEPHVGIFMKLCFTLYVHSMYSKGNEQPRKEQVLGKRENKIELFFFFFFCFNFKCLQSREFILFFTW
jgi:hypothetical protein